MSESEPSAEDDESDEWAELDDVLAKLGSAAEQGASPAPAPEISRKLFTEKPNSGSTPERTVSEANETDPNQLEEDLQDLSLDSDRYRGRGGDRSDDDSCGRNLVPPGTRSDLEGISDQPGETGNEELADVEPVPQASTESDVHPVPQPRLRLVNPAPRQRKPGRASGSTATQKQGNVHPVPQKGKSKDSNRLRPPSIPGHKWKPSGLSGWELYTRRASISANGKRSSTGDYLAYYSKEAVRRLHEQREKTANARTA